MKYGWKFVIALCVGRASAWISRNYGHRTWRHSAARTDLRSEPTEELDLTGMLADELSSLLASNNANLSSAINSKLAEAPASKVFYNENGMASASRTIFVVSDASGLSAQRLINSLIQQFDMCAIDYDGGAAVPCDVRTEVFPRVRDALDIGAIVQLARTRKAMIVYTLSDAEMRDQVEQMCGMLEIRTLDLIGPALKELSAFLTMDPSGRLFVESERRPNRRPLPTAYFRRIDAVEYTMKHDDGAYPAGLAEADLILVAPSRCGKTPLSMYLALNHGLRVANVPLVLGIPPPASLLQVDSRRVVGLTIHPIVLKRIRTARIEKAVGDKVGGPGVESIGGEREYHAPRYIQKELKEVGDLCTANGWGNLEVTERSVEESANAVLEEADRRGLVFTHEA